MVVGLVAMLAGLAAAELMVGLFSGTPSPVVAVGQAFIDGVPPAVKDWAIATFGTSNKLALIVGTLSVLTGLGALVGVLTLKDRSSGYVVAGSVGIVGMFAVITRPTASPVDLVPTAVGTLVTLAVLWRLSSVKTASGAESPVLSDPVPAARMGVDRRRFFMGVGGVGVASLVTGGVGRALQRQADVSVERADLVLPRPSSRAGPLPADAQVPVDGVSSFITPNDRFFRIDTALVVPQVSRDEWRLRIHGMVESEIELSLDDLLRRPQIERYITLSCVSNEVGGSLVGTARWQGVLLGDVLAEAGVLPDADQVVSRSVDGWTCGTPTPVIMDGRDALLAFGMNGEALPARHGYPVRMVVPGLFGYVSATKWVTDIELTTWDAFDAYWVPRGWSKEGPVKTLTRIDRPARVGGWEPGSLDIAGVAWAVHRGISAVQVRVDEGEWIDADLGGVPSDDTWRQWHLRWDAPPGVHVIEARAIDGDGVPQPEERTPVAPDGAQGYHRIRVVVDSP